MRLVPIRVSPQRIRLTNGSNPYLNALVVYKHDRIQKSCADVVQFARNINVG